MTNENTTLIKQALQLIADFLNEEYRYSRKSDPERMYENCCHNRLLNLAYTELGPNNEYPVQAMVSINHCKMVYMIVIDGSHSFHYKEYKDLKELIDRELSCLSFDDLIGDCQFYLEQELGREI